jgi:hypothetical protein
MTGAAALGYPVEHPNLRSRRPGSDGAAESVIYLPGYRPLQTKSSFASGERVEEAAFILWRAGVLERRASGRLQAHTGA